ncbi:MAG: hypothetical protein IPF41_16925 [Flavobacteriales bacterium]|nr:hypothetical protein [Flavobacteriales bacterium]
MALTCLLLAVAAGRVMPLEEDARALIVPVVHGQHDEALADIPQVFAGRVVVKLPLHRVRRAFSFQFFWYTMPKKVALPSLATVKLPNSLKTLGPAPCSLARPDSIDFHLANCL